MRVLITADLHVSDNPRDAYRLATLRRELPRLIKTHRVDALFILGDLTEAKSGHSSELVNAVAELTHDLAQLCDVVFIQGNHDWLSSPDNPFFEFLRRIKGVVWLKRPKRVEELFPDWDLGPALFLPHSADPERDWESINFKPLRWVFAHQTFTGAQSDSGMKLTGVSLSFFPKQAQVISGDIHTPQTFGQVTYVGAPYRVDFGDEWEPRMLLLTNKGLQSLSVPGPQKRLITVRSVQELARQAPPKTGDLVKVRVELPPEKRADWSQIVAQVKAWGGAAVHTVQQQMGAVTHKVQPRAASGDDKALLRTYAELRGVDEATLKTGLKFCD